MLYFIIFIIFLHFSCRNTAFPVYFTIYFLVFVLFFIFFFCLSLLTVITCNGRSHNINYIKPVATNLYLVCFANLRHLVLSYITSGKVLSIYQISEQRYTQCKNQNYKSNIVSSEVHYFFFNQMRIDAMQQFYIYIPITH